MTRSCIACALALFVSAQTLSGQQTPTQTPPVFRSGVNLVLVDVVVRDASGAAVRGLEADDFELLENGKRQQVLTFAYEEITRDATPVTGGTGLTTSAGNAEPSRPLTSEDVAGHRLLTLVFDTSSMEPDDVQKAVDGAMKWVDDQMTPADLVAVTTIDTRLRILTDFTSSKERVRAALSKLSPAEGTAFTAVDAGTASSDVAQSATAEPAGVDQSAQELDTFNNDVRLQALRTLSQALQPIQQKKAIIYFSSGMQRSGTDNQVELRAAVNAALRANVSIYPVDARGIQAIVPGGSARQASGGGLGAFTGSATANQFTQLATQQETLTSLAADTGGTAFTDTNDFGEAFTRVERDISSYYILGFSSSNTARDGRFRRLTVRVKNQSNVKVDAKDGYYADRDFAHTAKGDRDAQLVEQLATPIAATDVPIFVSTGWFRIAADKYYVPISVAVPGSAVPVSKDRGTLDIAGIIRDERGASVGQIRETLTLPPSETESLAARQVLYQTSVKLPPGRFSVKIAVRENSGGRMGTFEARFTVPALERAPLKMSSLVLGTQLQTVTNRETQSPLARDGVELVPNLTHIVGAGQHVYFYYEVYDPALDNGAPQLRTSLAFYRGKTKVYETPIVERTQIDVADRHAAVFQFDVPGGSLTPGLYTCQVTVIDTVARRFAFPRLQMFVR